jgi:hypothetical protein
MPEHRSLRYRRCPQCQVVRPASQFRRATGPTSVPGQLQRRRCPQCDHVGPLMSFPVAERPAEPGDRASL